MRNKKKSIGLLFLALPLLLLSACDNKTSSSSTSSSSQNSSLDSSSTTTSSEISTPWTPGEDFLEDADQPSVQNPQGRQSPLNILRKTQGQTGFPTLGEANILVVPVTLSDADQYTLGQYPMSFSSSLLSEIEESFFGEGGEIPSVKEFYDESSGGKLSLDGVVTPLYTMEATVEETLSDIAAKGISPFLKQLTKEVYDYFFVDSTRTYDPQDFDSDDDGKVDGIFLVTPFLAMGFGSSADAAMDALRGDYTISEGALSSPINSVSYVSGYDTFLTSALGTSSAPDSHLYITSLGSMMGLESYLDTVGDSTTGKLRTPLGLLDRMDGYIGDHNPFSKYQENTSLSTSTLRRDWMPSTARNHMCTKDTTSSAKESASMRSTPPWSTETRTATSRLSRCPRPRPVASIPIAIPTVPSILFPSTGSSTRNPCSLSFPRKGETGTSWTARSPFPTRTSSGRAMSSA